MFFFNNFVQYVKFSLKFFIPISGLTHTQGIQGNSGNFQVVENLREFCFFFLTQGSFGFSQKFQGNFKIFLKSQGNFLLYLE